MAFNNNLTSRSKLHPVPWYAKYPAASEFSKIIRPDTNATLVVDVGRNQGHNIYNFRDAGIGITSRLILQDLPEILARIEPLLEGIEVLAYDFFTPQPICGASIYYLYSVLHDWPDDQAVRILSRIAEAMDVNSKLLIDEIILKSVGESVSAAEMDMLMFLLCDGGERSLAQWEQLLAAAKPRLRIVKVWDAPGEQQSIIEAILDNP